MKRPEARFSADFPIRIAMDAQGGFRQVSGRCTDLSASGAQIETRDPLVVRSTVILSSDHFGRLGHANVRYCRREGMKYVVGVQFNVQLKLAESARSRMLQATVPSK